MHAFTDGPIAHLYCSPLHRKKERKEKKKEWKGNTAYPSISQGGNARRTPRGTISLRLPRQNLPKKIRNRADASASRNPNRRRGALAPTTMSFPDEEEDEAFLLAVAATEEAALASSDSSKRRRLSMTSSTSSSPTSATPPPAAVPEGPYLAALKGSHSSAWKQQQETLSQARKRPGGSQTLASPGSGSGSGGAQVARGGACFKCGDSSHWARECPQSVPATGGGGGGGAFGGSGGGGGGYGDAGGAVEEKACPCGAGSCLVLTSNTPRNPGRKFYRCPMRVSITNPITLYCNWVVSLQIYVV